MEVTFMVRGVHLKHFQIFYYLGIGKIKYQLISRVSMTILKPGIAQPVDVYDKSSSTSETDPEPN